MKRVRTIKAFHILTALTGCLGLTALGGCADNSKAAVSGKVTYHSAPVTGGTLTLYPASGPPYPININPDGSFNVSGAPVGPMEVAIDTSNVPTTFGYQMPPGVTPPKDVQIPEPPKIDAANLPKKVVIPATYSNPKTSGLTWGVKGGKNPPRDFNLTDMK